MNLKPYRPGQSGNPSGRPALPPEIRAERKRNQSALIKLIATFFSLSEKAAKARVKKPSANQLEKSVQGLITKSNKGDVHAFRYLMEIMVGKIPESDHDGFSEDDLRILTRVKEVFEEQERAEAQSARSRDPQGH